MPRYCNNIDYSLNRRDFLARCGLGLGGVALMNLLNGSSRAASTTPFVKNPLKGILPATHPSPPAKRVISLFMSGGPAQMDLSDHKPLLNQMNGQDLPASVRMGQ